ncbi:MAG: TolC family protein, partial [Alphaproteobacteria bacterium]|nr:TolC family protein [Alphaproteobacteria bacterium]
MSARFRIYGGAALVLALAACVPVSHPGARPALRTAETTEAGQTLAARGNTAWPPDQWWRLAGDPQLTALIEEGLANSPQVAVAVARVRRAEAEAQRVGAARLPSIGAEAEGGLRRQSGNNGIPAQFLPDGWKDYGQTSLSFGFDLDLWGRNRAALAAATSDARAAAVDAAQARLVLSVAITAAYAELGRHYRERDNAAAMLANRQAMRDIVAQRQRNGLDNLASLRRADAEVAGAEQDLAAVDENIGIRRNQLAALLGAGPDRGQSITRPPLAPSTPGGVPAGVTTDL